MYRLTFSEVGRVLDCEPYRIVQIRDGRAPAFKTRTEYNGDLYGMVVNDSSIYQGAPDKNEAQGIKFENILALSCDCENCMEGKQAAVFADSRKYLNAVRRVLTGEDR